MNPVVALIIANVIWGAAAPVFKFALTNIPPFTLAFLRFFIASLFFVPFIWKFNFKSLFLKDWRDIILGALFGITINIAFFFWGLQKSDSINAPIIASSSPLFLFILSIFFLHEKLKLHVLVGMFISLIGVLTIIFSPILFEGKSFSSSGELIGNLFYVVASIGAVVSTLFWKDVLRRVNVYVVTFISFVFSSITFLPFMGSELQSWSFMSLNIAGWIGILFGALLSSALAYLLYNYSLAKMDAQETGVFTYIDPVVAVIIAIPLVHEYPNAYFFIGSTLVFLGIYVSEKRIPYHPIDKIKSYGRKILPDFLVQ